MRFTLTRSRIRALPALSQVGGVHGRSAVTFHSSYLKEIPDCFVSTTCSR
jgi:hypothetical protein